MRFTKKELEPIFKVFQAVLDSRMPVHQMVRISVGREYTTFAVFSSLGVSIATFDRGDTATFNGVYSINTVASYLRTLKEEGELEFLKDKIKFGNSEYQFEPFTFKLENPEYYLEHYREKGQELQSELLASMDLVDVAGKFIDPALEQYNYVAFFADKIIGTNRKLTAILTANTSVGSPVFLPVAFLSVIKALGAKSLVIRKMKHEKTEQVCDLIEMANMKFFLPESQPAIEDYSSGRYPALYEHQEYVTVDHEELTLALFRMGFSAAENLDTRIYVRIEGNNLFLENRDRGMSYEKIACLPSSVHIDGIEFSLSCALMSRIITAIKPFGKRVKIHVAKEDMITVKFETEKGKFIQALVR